MKPVILLVRLPGRPEIVETFTTEDEAHARLAAFVREQTSRPDVRHADDDARAIADWFGTRGGFYAITRLNIDLDSE